MAAKVTVFGVLFTVMIGILVFVVEFFLPLSANSDMNICCRKAMLSMETEGGLSYQAEEELEAELKEKGFLNIVIDGTSSAKKGEEISLKVEADYMYSKMTGIFIRREVLQHMVYSKTTIARKVVN